MSSRRVGILSSLLVAVSLQHLAPGPGRSSDILQTSPPIPQENAWGAGLGAPSFQALSSSPAPRRSGTRVPAHPEDSLQRGLRASFQRVREMNRHFTALGGRGVDAGIPSGSDVIYPRRVNLRGVCVWGGVTYQGGVSKARDPELGLEASPTLPRPVAGTSHPRGSGERPRNCLQPPGPDVRSTTHPAPPASPGPPRRTPGAQAAAPRSRDAGAWPACAATWREDQGSGESLRAASLTQPIPGVRKLPPPSAGARMSRQFCSSAEQGDLSRALTADWPGAKTAGLQGKRGPHPGSPHHLGSSLEMQTLGLHPRLAESESAF